MAASAASQATGPAVLGPLAPKLDRAIDEALRDARAAGSARVVSVSVEESGPRDPLSVFESAAEDDRFYWEHPAGGGAFAAAGACVTVEAAGDDRFERVSAETRAQFAAGRHVASVNGPAPAPLFTGGFAFDSGGESAPEWRGFPAARWVWPERLYRVWEGRAWCTVSTAVEPAADPDAIRRRVRERLVAALDSPAGRLPPSRSAPHPDYRTAAALPLAAYRKLVRSALAAITSGDLEKVVVARSVRVEHASMLSPARLLEALRRSDPGCVSFAVAREGAVFLGATPELLVRLDAEGRLETGAVAGSAPRGRSPEEDGCLGRALRECKKEQAEHAVVVRAIRDALRGLCGELDGPEAPALLKLEGIQHLITPLHGRLRGDSAVPPGLLDLAGVLHPTAAVGGAPTGAAVAWLRDNEPLARGWYAAPLGFVDADGAGELHVALRCGLLRGGEARLFAGAGVVAGSDPERELAETRLKLRTLLAPLLEV